MISGGPTRGSLLFALAFLLAASHPAAAHDAPFSYLDLRIRDAVIDGVLVLHVQDVAHDLGVDSPEQLLDPAVAARLRDQAVALVSPRLTLTADRFLDIEWLDMSVAPERHAVQLRFRIHTLRPGSLTVLTDMFPYDPVHRTFVNVYEDDELSHQLIFAAGSSPYVYYTGTAQGAWAVMRTFIPAGVHHILIGPDHILFLVGLLLLGGRWQTLLTIVTAFTIGHSITLSLAALNLVTPPPGIIEPAIALSIVFVGADNLVRGAGRDIRAWIALVFGLVHGFGFANVLREFGLPREALGWSLFSFNAGVEVGQLAMVVAVVGILALIRRRSPAAGSMVARIGSMVVIAAGSYWFIDRAF